MQRHSRTLTPASPVHYYSALYTQVMQTIKGRKEHIDWITESAESMGKISTFMIESICLQLRMMIEDIAVACVIANADEMADLARGLRGEYRPNLILKGLEKIDSLVKTPRPPGAMGG